MSPFVLLALAYGAGATPTSLWVGKAVYGLDLRTKGSGNLGGTNTFRVLGWKAALPVIVVDIGKGWFPVWYFPQIQPEGSASTWALAYGAAAVLGHVFSFWVGLKGGKGIATSAGVLLGLAPIALAICLAVWLGVVWLTRIVSLASLSAALTLPVAVYLVPESEGTAMLWFAGGISVFVLWAHRSNIGRLLRGEESSFRGAVSERGAALDSERNAALDSEPNAALDSEPNAALDSEPGAEPGPKSDPGPDPQLGEEQT